MVTGGYVSGDKDTVTTELSINEGAWSTVSSGDLPTPRDGLRGVSLNNKVFMTGNKMKNEKKLFYTMHIFVLELKKCILFKFSYSIR